MKHHMYARFVYCFFIACLSCTICAMQQQELQPAVNKKHQMAIKQRLKLEHVVAKSDQQPDNARVKNQAIAALKQLIAGTACGAQKTQYQLCLQRLERPTQHTYTSQSNIENQYLATLEQINVLKHNLAQDDPQAAAKLCYLFSRLASTGEKIVRKNLTTLLQLHHKQSRVQRQAFVFRSKYITQEEKNVLFAAEKIRRNKTHQKLINKIFDNMNDRKKFYHCLDVVIEMIRRLNTHAA